jgi:hypothetical protein
MFCVSKTLSERNQNPSQSYDPKVELLINNNKRI